MAPEMSTFVYIVLFIVASTFAAPKKDIVFPACYKKDPHFNDCFKKNLQAVIPQLRDGYSKLKIPPIDPFDLVALDVTKGEGVVSLDLSLQKVKIYGLTSARIDTLKIDPENLTLYLKLSFGKPIQLIGSYTAKGKVQVLPINGKGPCNITIVDPILEITNTKGEAVLRNGVEYVTIKKANLKAVSISKLILKMDNLFQGNKQLSDHLNEFINENWELLYNELKPVFEEAIMAIVVSIAEKVAERIPLKDIFPE